LCYYITFLVEHFSFQIVHLKEELTKRGVTPDPKAKKSELIKLLQKPKPAPITPPHDPLALDAKLKRAQRFGLTGRTSPGARISTITDEETKKKLLIRAQRFGLPVNDQGKTEASKDTVKEPAKHVGSKTGAAVDDELEQKKRARMERFGLK
ncbi:hypothetical protein TELCIR_15604, partial [Teladorsagia circumcincta]